MSVMHDNYREALMERLREGVDSDGMMLTTIADALDTAYNEGAADAARDVLQSAKNTVAIYTRNES